MKNVVTATMLMIAALSISMFIYLGAYKPVELHQETAGPFRVVYLHHLGAYHKIVPVIEAVEAWAKEHHEACTQSFGEFLDSTDLIDEDRLNSNAGCFVTQDWTARLPDKMAYREIQARSYIVAEFLGAPSIGPLKVYPRAKDFIAAHHLIEDGAVIETYERLPEAKIKTRYYFPVRAH